MPLHGHVYTAPDGLIGFDTDRALKPSVAAAFFNHGYRFCVRYVRRDKAHPFDLSASEAESILEVGLGLMVVQYVESEESWKPTASKGTSQGTTAGAEADKVGVPAGVTLWCDLEGVAVGTPATDVIEYCNNWHQAVAAAGFVPGLYVGWHAGLSTTQLYRSVRFTHYWGAYNLNADQAPAVRGVQMKQSERRPIDVVPGTKIDFQTDKVRTDALGGRPTLLAPEAWYELL
ncbi:MAG TPA: glycoside hydrolase domain-containing protein [Gemmatimonadaceae bacterium]|nr:glycoside hydrolase domain-containing protein [Gemmatimonadaceae bacterium]